MIPSNRPPLLTPHFPSLPDISRSKAIKMLRHQAEPLASHIIEDRPYRTPKSYPHWQELASTIALSFSETTSKATLIHNHSCGLWLSQNAPMYTVSTELLRHFEKTDLPLHPNNSLLQTIAFPLSSILVLFPSNAIKTPDGGCLDWAIVRLDDANTPEFNSGHYRGLNFELLSHQNEYPRSFYWSSIDTKNINWYGGAWIKEDGSLLIKQSVLGEIPLNEHDHQFTHHIRLLCLQLFFAACFEPSLSADSPHHHNTTAASQSPRKNRSWTPRALSLPEKKTTAGKRAATTHASPRAHWRRGHWRNQAIGEGRQQRKLTWIKPTLIKP